MNTCCEKCATQHKGRDVCNNWNCPCHSEARQEGGDWHDRLELIWSRAEIPDYANDTKIVLLSLFEAELKAVEERVRKTVESLKHAEIESETREHKIRYSGYNEALDDVLSRLNRNEGETKV